MKTPFLACLALLLAPGAALRAQKMPLRDPDGRVVQILDLAPLWRGGEGGVTRPAPDLVLAGPHEPLAAPAPGSGAAIAAFVRSFIQPPLRHGDDVQALGDRWLAVLGSPQQATSAEQLIATAIRSREDHVLIATRILDLTPELFDQHLLPLLPPVAGGAPPGGRQAVLDGKAAGKLLVALERASITLAPRLRAPPLQRVNMSVMDEISYVKDFQLVVADQKTSASPVIATVWDGVCVDVIASYTGKDRIGLHCTLEKQDVTRPIVEFQTKLPGSLLSVTLQLPQVTGVRLQHTAEVPVGSTVLIAAKKTDGRWLAALVEVRRARE